MKQFRRCLMLISVGIVAATFGCGDASTPPPIEYDAQAKAKVESFKRIADALAKDPNSIDARGALEDFRNISLDAKKNRKEAEEIVEIYRQQVKGKYQGEVAQEVHAHVTGIENALKQTP